MGFRFRRSISLVPGVRLTVSKSGVALSAGVPGARVSVNTAGQVRETLGIPGSGISWTRSHRLRPASRTARPDASGAALPTPPGRFPSEGAAELHAAVARGDSTQVRAVAERRGDVALAGNILRARVLSPADGPEALDGLRRAWATMEATGADPASDWFLRTFFLGFAGR